MIRPAGPADAARAAEVLRASITRLCGADHHDDPARIGPWLADKTPAGLAALIADPGGRVYLSGRPAMAVGAVDWAGQPQGVGKVTLLYVHPQARGQGHSTALLAAMEAALAAMGRRQAILTATATARGFYLARGWRPAGPPRRGRWIVGHPMAKAL